MKHIAAAALIAAVTASPVLAQEGDDPVRQGIDLLSQGTRLLLQGLMKDMEPALRDLEGMIDDLNAYEAPQVLPNGDIIIRRKASVPDTAPGPAPGTGTGNEIEL